MTQPHSAGNHQVNTVGDHGIINATQSGNQTIHMAVQPSRPRPRKGFGWALLALLAANVLLALVIWAADGQYTGGWLSASMLLAALTVLTALMWRRLTRKVLGGVLRAVLRLFGKAHRATGALAGFLGTGRR